MESQIYQWPGDMEGFTECTIITKIKLVKVKRKMNNKIKNRE